MPEASAAAPNEPPPERRRTASGVILQIGAVAGAIASIVGIVLLGVHGVGSLFGHKSGVNPVETLRLSVPRPSVYHLTYAEWAKRNVGPTHAAAARAIARSRDAHVPGVEVDYDISAPHVAAGTRYTVAFTVLREPGNHPQGRPITDDKRLNRRGDPCGCASPFIRLPRTEQRYRVEVRIAPAGVPDDSPAHRGVTEMFSGTE